MHHAIQASHLTRRFGERIAVNDLSFTASAGEILGFLGPNGAGKTTTIRMLSGMIAPTSGSAKVVEIDPASQPANVHAVIGLLPESPGFYGQLSAERNLRYFAGFYPGIDGKRQVEMYLDRLGLLERKNERVAGFSKGMKQRLSLARALLHEPAVLFLDEPTSGLDPEVAHELRILIGELRDVGRTIFLSTHNLNEAEGLCDRVAVIRTSLVALDTPSALRSQATRGGATVTVQLETADSDVREAISALPYVASIGGSGEQLTVVFSDPSARPRLAADILAAGGNVLEMLEQRASLEDVYLNLVQDEERS